MHLLQTHIYLGSSPMLTASKKRVIQESLQQLSHTHSLAVSQIEATIAMLAAILELELGIQETKATSPVPIVNASKFAVSWAGRECCLGNTRLFWLFQRLATSANQYVSHEDLFESVWAGEKSQSALRGVVKRLRDQLSAAGMADLAKAIDGTVSGHYGLILV
ncbi:helix-turn-helix domain-containing protein [Blastopirellula marina]|uniref:OmpR/PhoB-type domain-containing protein n=1 Tax=Blastopirellula marina TaxID=124 RepID=A0A2S8F9S6_9BACT|nr:hypothetical protein C5Y98_24470 [Blastopirellula marina]PTL42191.1 helix-turn-helix domain-containing protein [Blastopirellula marina]